jgi:hypothetical protein
MLTGVEANYWGQNTAWRGGVLEKLLDPCLFWNFSAFHGNQGFIAVLKTACDLPLS